MTPVDAGKEAAEGPGNRSLDRVDGESARLLERKSGDDWEI